jgi:hypothetical protein
MVVVGFWTTDRSSKGDGLVSPVERPRTRGHHG